MRRFVSFEDRDWFDKAVTRVVEENIDPEAAAELHPEPYFVDFLRDMPEPTGEEPDDFVFEQPKVYEMVRCRTTAEVKMNKTGLIVF
ncbi:hypothetical protein NDU88_000986 [Pleurodeles waltl]|uniref:Uncharacterized protein n=1 Tax=Pleurodeles waltl TaxID=8319 RepID=A0AAV7R8F1_PLEWA|nr:hypothetical protein NDU88_000986 [Pleurodeles waltl]